MRNSKHGHRALILAIMTALGMMAFTAAGAQATELPGLSTLGSITIGPELKEASLHNVTGRQINAGSLLVKNRDLKIECQSLHVEEGKINSKTDGAGKVTFLKCLSFSLSTGTHLKDCQFKTLETITASALILPILHNNLTYLLFEPLVPGTPFTTVSYKEGTPCTLPLNNPVTGSVTALVDALEAVKQLILFSEAIQLLTGDKLAFGGNPAYIDGHAEIELLAPDAGQELGIH